MAVSRSATDRSPPAPSMAESRPRIHSRKLRLRPFFENLCQKTVRHSSLRELQTKRGQVGPQNSKQRMCRLGAADPKQAHQQKKSDPAHDLGHVQNRLHFADPLPPDGADRIRKLWSEGWPALIPAKASHLNLLTRRSPFPSQSPNPSPSLPPRATPQTAPWSSRMWPKPSHTRLEDRRSPPAPSRPTLSGLSR